MPDYPYVYGQAPPRPVGPGGTRLRVFRRRPPREGEAQVPAQAEEEAPWAALLESAVAELNASFLRSQAPWSCRLEEDQAGLLLRVIHKDAAEGPDSMPEEVDEVMEPADLPAWLARLRARLGLLIDETV